jgi:electron transfer flavoprotein beta subunit
MKIVVCVKHVPDPNYPMHVDPSSKRLVRPAGQLILDPADEFGLEIALRAVEEHGGEVVALTMGPAPAEEALRRAMAMGAERSIQIIDDALAGSDALTTARVLAAAIQAEAPDLVVCAVESTDAYTGMVPGALAHLLDLPQLTFARSVTISANDATVERVTELGLQTLRASLPALVTVTASVAEPRYPSFKGLMAAKRKPIETRDVASLGIDVAEVGEAGARERVLTIESSKQEKQGRVVVDDAGSSVADIMAYLQKLQIA